MYPNLSQGHNSNDQPFYNSASCQSSWVEIDTTGTMYSGCEVLNSSTNATLHPEIESCKDWACQQGANAINW